MPRYSRIAMFKERLDTRLGPGDLNRGLYRRPKPVGGHIQQERGASDVMDGDESNVDAKPGDRASGNGTDDSDAATTEDMRPTKRHIGRHERDLRPISQEVGERGPGSDSED
ncbi:uncharacterized protein B0H18DRAFT_1112838 [Fomitopsis serialis]|uniref:uncharacterized protein n=1 Tax=Fomitopsis serialis TaxID=139415 RepID=UPI002007A32A|nr:uncharacterized protein B0H18DRAFT_1112838 [Neoantrodia serialis]KAH9938713.1 hypothetical protein B0H18DRAFT_1112838 [Neoantrodia serialis]